MGTAERKEREKEQRRQDIVVAAEKVFFSKGVISATIDEVAEKAELSKGTIYLYFKSKEDLIHAIMLKGLDILKDMLLKNLTPEKNGYMILMEMAYTFIRFSTEYRNYFNIMQYCESNVHCSLEISEAEFKRQVMEDSPLPLVVKCVEQGQNDGSIRKDIPANILASLLWSQMMGLIIVANTHNDIYTFYSVTIEDMFRAHIEIVSNGFKLK